MSDSVELATAYLNPSPQLNTAVSQLPGLTSRPNRNPDPRTTGQTSTPWALNRRLAEETRTAIVAAYRTGTRQQVLADRYGISLSSIKRLLRAAH
jgi:hypothetical protein